MSDETTAPASDAPGSGEAAASSAGEGRIFVVSDDARLRDSVESVLDHAGYEVRGFPDAEQALDDVASDEPEVVVKDHDLPFVSTLEFLQRGLDHDPLLKVVMLVRPGDESSADVAVRAGAFGYTGKPADPSELTRVVRRAFTSYLREDGEHRIEAALRLEAARQSGRIKKMTVGTLTALLNAQEARTPMFRGHSQNVAECAAGIARALGLSGEKVSSIRTAGLLHDLGMIAVPDEVVNKPGNLSTSEFAFVAAHPRRGAEILQPMDHLGDVPRFVLEHHERIDGSGYPNGRKGDEISLGGQIVGLAEYWTAITEDRPFRDRMSTAEAMDTLTGTGGTWFAPELLRALRVWKTAS